MFNVPSLPEWSGVRQGSKLLFEFSGPDKRENALTLTRIGELK